MATGSLCQWISGEKTVRPQAASEEVARWQFEVAGYRDGLAIGAAVSLFMFRLTPFAPAPVRTTPLTSLPGQERYPSFSPDGNQIAFAWDGENGDNQDI